MEDPELNFRVNFYVQRQEPKIVEMENSVAIKEREGKLEERKKVKLKNGT